MLFLAVLAVGLLAVRPLGGRFTTLAEVHLRGTWILVLALLVQVLDISVLVRPPHLLAATLHVSSYCLAAAFLWRNRRLRGMAVAAAGGALNLLAITVNGGTMPATAGALRLAGIRSNGMHFANSTNLAHSRLGFLGDVFAVPQSLGALANVFSVGDIVLALGAVWLLHAAAGCPWAIRRSAARKAPPGTPRWHPLPRQEPVRRARHSLRRASTSPGTVPAPRSPGICTLSFQPVGDAACSRPSEAPGSSVRRTR